LVATVQIEELTGGSDGTAGTYTVKNTVTTSRYFTADSDSASATTNPIPIPNDVGAGRSGSYWKTHLLNIVSKPDVRIENIRYYVQWTTHPSSQWTLCGNNILGDHVIGVSSASIADAKLHSNGLPSSQYDIATGTVGVCGDFISGNHLYYNIGGICPHSYLGGATSTWNFKTQATAMMVQSGQVSHAQAGGSPSGNSVGRTYAVVTQVIVASGAIQGEKADVTATWVYDEV
jgi:hypothetical protein